MSVECLIGRQRNDGVLGDLRPASLRREPAVERVACPRRRRQFSVLAAAGHGNAVRADASAVGVQHDRVGLRLGIRAMDFRLYSVCDIGI